MTEILGKWGSAPSVREVRELTPGEYAGRQVPFGDGHLRMMPPVEQAGRLIPVEEIERDEDLWEDERHFRRDRATEDVNPVPSYPEPPEYIPPPVYDE